MLVGENEISGYQMGTSNLFAAIPPGLLQEVFEELAAGQSFRLERIVSRGQSTPPEEWLEQDMAEWVVLLRGEAGLCFQGDTPAIVMRPGDYVRIPARTPHRVEWTVPDDDTVWMALHFDE